jgi:1-phosphofructokinase
MILTVTLDPAADQTIFVPNLAVGRVNLGQETQLDPAGKGVNVSRMVHRLGWPTVAFGFLGGEIGALIRRALDDEGVQHHFVPIAGQTRLSVTIVGESHNTATSVRVSGPEIPPEKAAELDRVLEFWLQAARVLVLAGRLPPGVPADVYARYIEAARANGVLTILDAEGEPLRLGVAARPSLVKPNREEAEGLMGRSLPTITSVVDAGRELTHEGIETVIISLGSRGAVCVSGDHAWQVRPPALLRRSTVGSGDSLAAGIAVAMARGDPLIEWLRLGTAAGAATAATPGTAHGSLEEVLRLMPHISVTEIS